MRLYNKYFDEEENMFSDLYRSVDYGDYEEPMAEKADKPCGEALSNGRRGLFKGFGFDGMSSLSIILLLLLLLDGEDDEKLIIIMLALVFGI